MPKGNKKLSGVNQKRAKAGQGTVKKKSQSDFAKVRHKVGRKLPPPPNATVTTVKAKRLVLAGQSVGVDRSQRAVSARGLALEELLPQLSHYAQRVRLDATTGLQELLTTHPWCVYALRVWGALCCCQPASS
jgi:pre-rRNA-processing protein IPI1